MLPAVLDPHGWPAWLIWPGALAATLVLAAWCTPRTWWRRPNLRALAVLAGGTLGLGLLCARLLPAASSLSEPDAAAAFASMPAAPAAVTTVAMATAPAAGDRWRVADDLNLRADRGVRGARLTVLAAGTIVRTTGATDGDWWRVRGRVGGRDVEGWASSLWLRRVDEAPAAH